MTERTCRTSAPFATPFALWMRTAIAPCSKDKSLISLGSSKRPYASLPSLGTGVAQEPFGRGILMKRRKSLSRSIPNAAYFPALAAPFRRLLGFASPIRLAALASFSAALSLAGCAPPPPVAHEPEYFPSSVYGEASPHVVATQDDSIPHGGGSYKVGQPYVVDGKTYYPSNYKRYSGVGYASWYGDAFHGRRTANGEIYSRNSISAAHPTMPLPSYARVTNLRNHYSIIVRVNDRGPFAHDRIMDVSQRVAELLDFRRSGTTKVKIDYVGSASLAGSDDTKLLATLRQDGRLAQLDMRHPPTFVAETQPVQTASAEIPGQAPAPLTAGVDPQAAAVQPGTVDPQTGVVATDDTTGSIPASVVFKGPMPLPPSRPFDLDAGSGSESNLGTLR